jgi:acetyl esterase/lipase
MRAHARALHVDPTRIGVVGMSSGGYVAAALATNEWSGRDWSGAPADARVQGAVLFNPVLDLASLAAGSMPEPLEQFMGVAFATDSARWKDASPLRHLGPSAAPSLYLHGRNDELVPYTQSVEAQHRLAAAGVRAEIFVADSAGHGFFTRPQWREPMLARMSDFLSAVLKSSAP